HPSGRVGRRSTRVELDYLVRGRGDSFAQLGRFQHLRVGPELQQLPKRILETLEADDAGISSAPQIFRQTATYELTRSQLHFDARKRRLEALRPIPPVLSQIEALWPFEPVLAHTDRGEARHPVDTHTGAAACDQVPGAALEHEPQGVERAPHDASPLPVARAQPASLPRGRRDRRKVRDGVLGTKPAARIQMEEALRAPRALLQLRRQGREELQARTREHATE